jgi:beta-glucosidase
MSSSVLSPYIVSDCHAIGDMATTCDCSGGKPGGYKHPGHNFVSTGNEAVAAALFGGTDVNCGCYYKNWLNYALGNKTSGLTSTAVDLAAGRVANALIRVGALDAEGMSSPFTKIPTTVVDNAAARALAMEAAQQSIVLLENRPAALRTSGPGSGAGKPLLPLSVGANINKLAFIGPHADATQAMLSNYHGDNDLVNLHSPLAAAKARWPSATVPSPSNIYGIFICRVCM